MTSILYCTYIISSNAAKGLKAGAATISSILGGLPPVRLDLERVVLRPRPFGLKHVRVLFLKFHK